MTTDSHPTPIPNGWHDQDVQGRSDSNVTREFWGDGADWASQSTDTIESAEAEVATSRGGIGATVGRWWGSTGRRGATRTHAPAISSASPDETDDDVASLDDDQHDLDTDWDDAWETAPADRPRSGVDPLLARLGGLAVILTLLVPVVMGFTSDDGEAVRTSSATLDVAQTASGDQPAEQPTAAASATDAPSTPVPDAMPPVADAQLAVDPVKAVPETLITAPVVEALAVDVCALEYQVVAGDFWIRIADGSGAALADVLGANDATVSTPLYPGRSICLPDGATIPSPPPVAAVPTSTASSSTRSFSTSVTGSKAPTTPASTPATTTPAPPPPASTATPAEVEAIIRAVWPDELEARALKIAWRESNYKPTAKNSCCYGVFQVYWSVHRSWLGGLGITSADQLYDPATNARAALALHERAGGWGPWGG